MSHKPTLLNLLAVSSLIALSSPAFAAIAWAPTPSQNALTANVDIDVVADEVTFNGEWEGLSLNIKSSVDASLAFTDGERIDWSPNSSITGGVGGTTVVINFLMNTELYSAERVNNPGQRSRAMFSVRQLAGTSFENDMSLTYI